MSENTAGDAHATASTLRSHASEIRANRPNGIWHSDTSVVRLFDGTHAYLYAVVDNFSRRILAWRVSERFDLTMTLEVLIEAGKSVIQTDEPPTLFADAGVENRTAAIDELINSGILRRVLAQTEIAFSNSMIESWWRTLKHQWLYLNTLDTVESLRRLVAFYVREHNTQLPHSAFKGQTPDEMYHGTGTYVPQQLAGRRKTARAERLATNRSVSCGVCDVEAAV